MKSSLLAVLSAVATTSMAMPQQARACSSDAAVPHLCAQAQILLPDPAVIPPGATALPIFSGSATDFALTMLDGAPVATQTDASQGVDSRLMLLEALTPNAEYRVTYRERCIDPTQPLQTPGTPKSFSFRTSAAVPFPTTLGEVSVQKELGPVEIRDSCGDAISEKQAAVVALVLKPTAELKPWLPLLSRWT